MAQEVIHKIGSSKSTKVLIAAVQQQENVDFICVVVSSISGLIVTIKEPLAIKSSPWVATPRSMGIIGDIGTRS